MSEGDPYAAVGYLRSALRALLLAIATETDLSLAIEAAERALANTDGIIGE